MATEANLDFNQLFEESFTYEEAVDFYSNLCDNPDAKSEFCVFIESEIGNQVSFQAKAHLGFVLSISEDDNLAKYFENLVLSEILLANDEQVYSMFEIPEAWPNNSQSNYIDNFSSFLELRQNRQLPLVERIDQVTYLEDPQIDDGVVKVRLAFDTMTIQSSAIIKVTRNKPVAQEIKMYMNKAYPRFYGILSNIPIENKICRLTFFDKHTETLKQNISFYMKFQKKNKDELAQRLDLALKFYKELKTELNTYRDNQLFHKNVFPSNILVYNSNETLGENCIFLFNGDCDQFKITDNYSISSFNLCLDYDKSNKYYVAPEIVNHETYCQFYNIDPQDLRNYNSDVWSSAACILHMITGQNIDKWNDLNFSKILMKIINTSTASNEKLNQAISSPLKHDSRQRLRGSEDYYYDY